MQARAAGLARARAGPQGCVYPCGTDGRAMSEPLLRVWNLTKEFPIKGGLFGRHAGSVHAVDAVDFNVDRAETLWLVSESGCGKRTTAPYALPLPEPTP